MRCNPPNKCCIFVILDSVRVKNYILLGSILILLSSFLIRNVEEIPTDFCFDFDEVTYYHIEITEDAIHSLLDVEYDYTDKKEFQDAQHLYEILTMDYPQKITDTTFIDDLVSYNFQVKSISSVRFGPIKKIFCDKNNDEQIRNICLPYYRDILVFKKDNKINGLAKICFTCRQEYLLRPNANLLSIIAHLNYSRLHNFLISDNTISGKK